MFVSYYSEISLQLSGSDQQYGLPTIPEALCSVKRNFIIWNEPPKYLISKIQQLL